jgi:hypothetical protein
MKLRKEKAKREHFQGTQLARIQFQTLKQLVADLSLTDIKNKILLQKESAINDLFRANKGGS